MRHLGTVSFTSWSKLPMPKAVAYLLARTGPLRECFLHAPSRIDNNLAENSLRRIRPNIDPLVDRGWDLLSCGRFFDSGLRV
jgi:hypothetical protein